MALNNDPVDRGKIKVFIVISVDGSPLGFVNMWLVIFRVKGDEHHEQKVYTATEKAKGLEYEN